MLNSRQKILNYLLEQHSATVEELSKAFKVTPANIRHHLSILLDQGTVKVIGQQDKPGKGRPSQIYSCSQDCDKHNLEQLVEALISTLRGSSDSKQNLHLVKVLAQFMGASFKSDPTNPTRRLYYAVQSLNRMKYQAHWEAHIENPRIMLGHCPYQVVLGYFPEICQMDSYLLENLLGTSVRQVEKQLPNEKGIPQCIFLFTNPAL